MTKQDPVTAPSEALLAAQRRLLILREEHRARLVAQPATAVPEHGRPAIPSSSSNSSPRHAALPPHLGWESAAVTAVLQREQFPSTQTPETEWLASLQPSYVEHSPTPNQMAADVTATVVLLPDIALGMLQQNRVASGRLWLLLRYLDQQGRGWLTAEAVRTAVTSPQSSHRFCGQRQLRNLLREGDAIFWTRSNGRIWLRSHARVADALGIARLAARPVSLPVSILTESIGTVRAHFYATFHSARSGKPVARATLARVTAVAERTQRHYEQHVGVKTRANFAIGERAAATDSQAAAWNHGHSSFKLIDYTGQHGLPGIAYQAWQLPNSYSGPHPRLAKHARKRVNRQLADLQQHGKAGNDQLNGTASVRKYAGNGREAAVLIRRGSSAYWPAPGSLNGSATGIWYELRW